MILDRLIGAAGPQRLALKALSLMEPETAHRATLTALATGLAPKSGFASRKLAVTLCGLDLPNPLGMAAGFDKNAEVPGALLACGFGFIEVGTVTPRAQEGNPRPRLFRLPEAGGVINRMGFNNEGHDAVYERLARREKSGVVGVNIGANKDSADFVADYVKGVERFSDVADYLTANVSSPNTPGLRDLQADEALRRLLDAVLEARGRQARQVPVLLKIAPDLDEAQMDAIARVVGESGVDGLIVSNTTISRDAVAGAREAGEAGGLSGKPLFALATRRLAQMRQRLGPDFPIIGVGGIHSAETAIAKFEAGANAIQLYSALVYGGMTLADEILSGLDAEMSRRGLASVADLTGSRVAEYAAG